VIATSETSFNNASSIIPQENFIQNDMVSQSAKHVAMNIPRRLTDRPLPETEMIDNTRLKPKRLVSISHEGSRIVQDQAKASTTKSWRCPYCRRPFLLKGDLCYCPKCGLTRPLFG